VKDERTGKKNLAQIRVLYTVEEGQQQTFGSVTLSGVDPQWMKDVKATDEHPGRAAVFVEYGLG